MNFTYTAFAKAAKRLAETDDLKLSEAQEKLAKTLGFKNHHAAQAALQAQDAAISAPEGYNGRFWLGLTWMQTFELLTLGGRFQTGDNWGLRSMELLRIVSSHVFSKPVSEPVMAKEIVDGLDIKAILRLAKEVRERGHAQELARHHALLVYAGSIQMGSMGRFADEPTAAAIEQHGYLVSMVSFALSTLFLLESSSASSAQALALHRSIKSDPERLTQHIVELEAQARFSAASSEPN